MGGKLELLLADGDFHWRQSLHACRRRLQGRLRTGYLTHDAFPGCLTVSVTVECTRDEKLLLCRRVDRVAANPKEWSVGIGEMTDPSVDDHAYYLKNKQMVRLLPERGLHPHNTTLRGLREELGCQQELEQVEFSYLALCVAIENVSVTRLAHARFDLSS